MGPRARNVLPHSVLGQRPEHVKKLLRSIEGLSKRILQV